MKEPQEEAKDEAAEITSGQEQAKMTKKETQKPGYKKIEFIQKQEKFIGTDLQEYGPYEPGDIAEIPEEMIKVLINKDTIKTENF